MSEGIVRFERSIKLYISSCYVLISLTRKVLYEKKTLLNRQANVTQGKGVFGVVGPNPLDVWIGLRVSDSP